MATGFCVTQTPPTLLLLLSKLCLELEGSTVNFLVRYYSTFNLLVVMLFCRSRKCRHFIFFHEGCNGFISSNKIYNYWQILEGSIIWCSLKQNFLTAEPNRRRVLCWRLGEVNDKKPVVQTATRVRPKAFGLLCQNSRSELVSDVEKICRDPRLVEHSRASNCTSCDEAGSRRRCCNGSAGWILVRTGYTARKELGLQ